MGTGMGSEARVDFLAPLGLRAVKRQEYISGHTRQAAPTISIIDTISMAPILGEVGKL